MIEISATSDGISMVLPSTAIGTCEYNARIFPATGEVLHTVKAINGIQLQWVTLTLSLAYAADDAVAEIARQRPLPEFPEAPPAPVNW